MATVGLRRRGVDLPEIVSVTYHLQLAWDMWDYAVFTTSLNTGVNVRSSITVF